MSILVTTLRSALISVGVQSIKQVISSKLGGVQPTTVSEQLQLEDQDIKRREAVAKLDNPGGVPSQWVIDLRASSRYIAAWAVIVAGLSSIYMPSLDAAVKAIALEAANVAFGFLFGSRIVSSYNKK